MKLWVGIASLVLATACWAKESGIFQPASTNVWGAEYPRVDNAGRVQIRVKAPDATKIRLNFWSGPKMDMEKQADGFWTVTTPVVRKNSIRLPSDSDAGTYLFGILSLGNPKNQSCEQ
jgi:hypothetical protein